MRFSPTAWAKLLFLRDYAETEVGGFGIAAADDLLLIQDIRLVRQSCTLVSVAFDDAAVADFFDAEIDAGLRPEQFGRIWIHTHPGESAQPSPVDEETCARVFGACDWSVMFILARGGQTSCRLRFRAGPGGSFEIPVAVDFECDFGAADFEAWEQEYAAAVRPVEIPCGNSSLPAHPPAAAASGAEPLLRTHRLIEDLVIDDQMIDDLGSRVPAKKDRFPHARPF